MLPELDGLISPANQDNSEITFHPFLRLPPELRVMVWKMILPVQRVVRIRDANDFVPEEKFVVPPPWHLPDVDLKVVQEVPVILQVNIESRKEGLNFYSSQFYSRLKNPILFDFSQDILVFDGHSPCIDFLSFFYFWFQNCFECSIHAENPERIPEWGIIQNKLRNLVIGNSEKTRFRDWVFYVLAGFTQLKLLGSPSATDYFIPSLAGWPVDQIRYPPPGPMWRVLHRHWALIKAGIGRDLSLLSRREAKNFWGSLMREDAQFMKFIWSCPISRAILGVTCREDLMNEVISKEKTRWATDTDIYFFEDDELQDFLLELETKVI